MHPGADLRHALRSIRREPGFAIATILTLTLGIGANAAMFGLVDRLLLSPPAHIRSADRVATLGIEVTTSDNQRFTMTTTSYAAFRDIRSHTKAFSSVAAVAAGTMVYGHGADARSVNAAKV